MTEPLSYNLRKLKIYTMRNLKFDFIAAIVVFLVAIPLCLGIALASGAPLFSGILSGIIGGIVVGSLSGSQVSVTGPAAGMAGVVFAAITQLDSFQAFLLALTFAGLIQIFIGGLKAGFIADYIPSNIIQGLLCAIGILLIIKQLPLAFTLSSTLTELKGHLLDVTSSLSLTPLLNISMHINTGAMIISLSCLALLIYFDKTKSQMLKAIPGPIIAVLAGIIINEVFSLSGSFLTQHGPHLVNIPKHEGFMEFLSEIQSPDWGTFNNPQIYLYALIIAIVASLESLLNVKAGEKLDKSRRYCSKDQELLAQGFGNLIAGLIGGIPVTSVIIRTSVNIQAGSRTKFSTILHGVFILFAVMIIPEALNKIPLSSLAAILIYTGYKLTKPAIYLNIYRQGMDRFFPFIVTIICIVALNLLAGILIGLLISLFFILKSNSEVRLDIVKEIYPHGTTNRLILPQQITFLNKASLVTELDSIPAHSQLIIDAHYSEYIDKEIVEFIKEFQQDLAPLKHISLNIEGFKEQYNIHNYVDFINVTTYDVQATLTPAKVLSILKEGNMRFTNGTMIHRNIKSDIQYTAATQYPIAVVLGCIDSRVPIETVFDMSFGDIFCIRIAGNVINNDILASIEFACDVAGAKLIVVLGHTNCGAIKAACDDFKQGHLTELLHKIKPAISAETTTTEHRQSTNTTFVDNVMELNIANTLQQIYQKSEILRSITEKNQIGMVGAVYDIKTGAAHFKDYSKMIKLFGNHDNQLLIENIQTIIQTSTECNTKHE